MGGPNLYGVANTGPALYYGTLLNAGGVTCPAGVETNVIALGPVTALAQGVYYPVFWAQLSIQSGATAPTQIVLGAKIGAGADFATFQPYNGLFIAGQVNVIWWYGIGQPSRAPWVTPGSVINITVNPLAQSVSCVYYCSQAIGGVFRAPDS